MGHWLILAFSILLEVAGTVSMKLSDGLTRLVPSLLIVVFYVASFGLFALALKRIDLSIAYSIWAGMGTALIAIIGIVVFKEGAGAAKLLSIALIVVGVVGLNLVGRSGSG